MSGKTILVTGAAGHLGGAVARHLIEAGHRVRALDIAPCPELDGTVADLSVRDGDWVSAFSGVDCVVHLAGAPSPRIDWATAQSANIDATLNVYAAAAQAGCGRVIFASSNWVLAGHRDGDTPLTPDTDPAPINPYGCSKLFGERAGLALSGQVPSVIAFRIGYCPRPHGQRRAPFKAEDWFVHMWLTKRDLLAAHLRAVESDHSGFAVLNLMSDVQGSRWDTRATSTLLGLTLDRLPTELIRQSENHKVTP